MIVCDDVLHWAETYQGPKCHALIADPPYHLTADDRGLTRYNNRCQETWRSRKATSGFMGKTWDGGIIAHDPQTWEALAQHLLPGAFLMAFASSRGWHRLAGAMEDAGLILHPSIFNYRTGETLDIGMYGWAQGAGFPKATRIDTQVDHSRRRDYVLAAQRLGLTIPGNSFHDWTKGDHVPSNAWWERFKKVLTDEQWHMIERQVIGQQTKARKTDCRVPLPTQGDTDYQTWDVTAPATPLAATWAGHRYGLQALKPALEPIIVAQVPYQGRSVESITQTGAGAWWIEGGRISLHGAEPHTTPARSDLGKHGIYGKSTIETVPTNEELPRYNLAGRWPPHFALLHTPQCQRLGTREVQGTNIPGPGTRSVGYGTNGLARDGIQNYASPEGTETVPAWRCAEGCPIRLLDEQAGERKAGAPKDCQGQKHGYMSPRASTRQQTYESFDDTGGPSRFFQCADWSLDVAEQLATAAPVFYAGKASRAERDNGLSSRNAHPTIKPLSLCTWLAALLLPPAAYAPRRLLVPFAGTGSEILGGVLAGWDTVLGIEQEESYVTIARQRIAWWTGQTVASPAAPTVVEQETPQVRAQQQLSLWKG